MAIARSDEPSARKPLRLWPGVLAAALLVLIRYVLPVVWSDGLIYEVIGGLACALAVVVWWVFFSRAPWSERLGMLALMAIAMLAASRIIHESIAGGLMGMMYPVFAFPTVCLAFVTAVAAGRRLADGPRRAAMAAAILLGCGVWAFVRTGGITGDAESDFHWRWTETPEEQLLARGDTAAALPQATAAVAAPVKPPAVEDSEPAAPPVETEGKEAPAAPPADRAAEEPAAPAATKMEADWPGFRGPRRDGVVRGVRIATDWSASPPVELWRRPIGPGWSSFAVQGDRLYTQEQRGDDEIVACYKVTTGEPVWGHRDAARFWESNGGAGPRGTPTLSNGRVYTLGATGILNALDAEDGAVIWSRNLSTDAQTEVPGWGFASSPLVVGDLVVAAAAGKLVAYDLATGEPRWFGPDGSSGYSSPHLATLGGVPQILFLSGAGATSFAPADGKVLWQHALPSGSRIVQPALIGDGDVLVNDGDFGDGNHLRRLAVARGPSGWTAQERWSSIGLKPNFNDYVVHKGHAFGFDGSMLSCIGLEDGKRKWKGGHYGHGQLVLLPEQDLLLVLSEQGELALVKAAPDQFTELAKLPAIAGKTWNHPVLVGNVLLVRNGEEMAAFRLAPANSWAQSNGTR
jgi:outer membrane protein assembly factor BamB